MLSDELCEPLISVFTLIRPDPMLVPDPFRLETSLVTPVETPTLVRTFDSDPAAEHCSHRRQDRHQNFPNPKGARVVSDDYGDRNRRRRQQQTSCRDTRAALVLVGLPAGVPDHRVAVLTSRPGRDRLFEILFVSSPQPPHLLPTVDRSVADAQDPGRSQMSGGTTTSGGREECS